jgi:hypothetical protein
VAYSLLDDAGAFVGRWRRRHFTRPEDGNGHEPVAAGAAVVAGAGMRPVGDPVVLRDDAA